MPNPGTGKHLYLVNECQNASKNEIMPKHPKERLDERFVQCNVFSISLSFSDRNMRSNAIDFITKHCHEIVIII